MQSAGFAQFITPAIKKIYEGDDELIAQKTEQYLSTFYNTENTMGQIIHGASLALEESETPEITETAVALRTGLMGPFAGLGDSIFKVSAKVIFGSLAGYMALENSVVGLLLCCLLYTSQYGVACAKLLALNIRNGYGKEIRAVVPAEAYEYVEDEPTEFDVILTDIGKNRKMYLDLLSYHLPILQVEFLPFQFRCPELDTYLSEVQKNCEWTILKKQYFYRTNLISKEGVFQYLADLFEQYGVCLLYTSRCV